MDFGSIRYGQEEEISIEEDALNVIKRMNTKAFGNRLSIEEMNKLISQNKCFKC